MMIFKHLDHNRTSNQMIDRTILSYLVLVLLIVVKLPQNRPADVEQLESLSLSPRQLMVQPIFSGLLKETLSSLDTPLSPIFLASSVKDNIYFLNLTNQRFSNLGRGPKSIDSNNNSRDKRDMNGNSGIKRRVFNLILGLFKIGVSGNDDMKFDKQHVDDQLHGRDVTVQLFQWNYKDIGNECGNFLGTNGYRYVQISPPQEHILGDQWWKDYQPVSYKIGSRRGTEAELKEMIDKCEKSGVGVIADVVLNHMTAGSPSETRIGSLGSEFKKYDYKFNGYTRGDFHDCGRNGNNLISNYSDRYEVQNCELAGLSDLNTSKESVRRTIKRYLNRLIELGIRGFRIDAAKHMDSIDVKNFLKDIPVRVVQEVIYGFSEPIQPIEYLSNGRVHIFRGASELRRMFMNDGIAYLASPNPWGERWGSGYLPGSHSQVFITNWDMERGGTVALRFDMEPQIYILAQVFVLTWDYGQIDIYSGYNFTSYDDGPEQASVECGRYGWRCEHRNPVIVGAVKLRSHISNEPVTNIMTSGIQRLAFNRGSKAFIAINNEDSEWILDGIEVKLDFSEDNEIRYYNLLNNSDEVEEIYIRLEVDLKKAFINRYSLSGRSAIGILATSNELYNL